MLTDGVRLVNGSIIDLGVVSEGQTGTTLPASATEGAEYELTALYSGNVPGVYWWHNSEWVIKSPDRSATPYDLSGGTALTLAAAALVMRSPITRAVGMVAGFFGSIAFADQAPTAAATLEIRRITRQKADEKIGEIFFDAGETVGVFIQNGTGVTRFAHGEVLYIRGPNVADTTLSGLAISLAGFLM
jgi:hypothetical protein